MGLLKCSKVSILYISIEGERVKIQADSNKNCTIVIENAGPEDNGTWKFEMITKKSHQFFRHIYEASIVVNGMDL